MRRSHGVAAVMGVILAALVLNTVAASPKPASSKPAGVPEAAGEAGARDFDFYPGVWRVKNRKLAERLKGSQHWLESEATDTAQSVLGGLGVLAQYRQTIDGKPFEGVSLYLFNPATREWSLYWADSVRGTMDPPLVGRFAGGKGTFIGDDQHDGKPIKIRFIWSPLSASSLRWEQAFSADQGKTWETNWLMELTRVK